MASPTATITRPIPNPISPLRQALAGAANVLLALLDDVGFRVAEREPLKPRWQVIDGLSPRSGGGADAGGPAG